MLTALPPALRWRSPVLEVDYPVEHRPPAGLAHTVALARLLGHSRAAVLQSLATPGTTSEVARTAGVLVSSASQHLSALRDARLVDTVATAGPRCTPLTALGAALLHGDGVSGVETPSGSP